MALAHLLRLPDLLRQLALRRSFRTGACRYALSNTSQEFRSEAGETQSSEQQVPKRFESQVDGRGTHITDSHADSTSASAKLFADAALAETEEAAAARPHPLVARAVAEAANENWTGDEPLRDAVLRMLVDAHRPLRAGTIRSADEKLKERPPTVRPSATGAALLSSSSAADQIRDDAVGEELRSEVPTYAPNWRERAHAPLLPAVEGHRPWHTTFTAPAHATARVKLGNFAPRSARAPGPGSSALPGEAGIGTGPGAGAGEGPAAKRRSESAARLGRVRESIIDYRLGIRGGGQGAGTDGAPRRPMPVSMKGWASLVEERIQRARQQGHFKTLKGHGQPLVRETAEGNPFIGREEFLMNRIVRRNNAAPPWVELQAELDSAVSAFRASVQDSWTRRAIRMLTLNRPHSALAQLTDADAAALRDSEWEAREAAYQEVAVSELNALVRRYNGAAPYAVRRPVHDREAELARVYRESAPDIVQGVRERLRSGAVEPVGVRDDEERSGSGSASGSRIRGPSGVAVDERGRRGLWEVVRGWFAR